MVTAYRANRILYNFIKSNSIQGEVIVPANLCRSVVDTLYLAGMRLYFVDISEDTLCVDDKVVIERARDASLLVFVHTYGIELDCPAWFSTIKRINPKLAIVDDRCLCLPQLSLDGCSADLVLFSTCSKKQVDLGVGGIGFLSEKWEYNEIVVESNAILTNRVWTPVLESIEERIQDSVMHKEHINSIYYDCLPSDIQLPKVFQNWRFNILVSNKGDILENLFSMGLFASSHYCSLSDQCSVAVNLHKRIINLFNDFYYSEEKAIRTCKVINNVMRKIV